MRLVGARAAAVQTQQCARSSRSTTSSCSILLYRSRHSSMSAEVSARRCHGEDARVVRVLGGGGQEHPTGLVPDRLRDPEPLHPGLLLAQPHAAEPPEQAGQLHGESGHGERRPDGAPAPPQGFPLEFPLEFIENIGSDIFGRWTLDIGL